MPEGLRDVSHVTGIELDPVTARIARLLQPQARIITGDFARTELPASFDLAIGNPPFSDRTVRSDRAYRSLSLRLHDYFIARSIDLLKPGAFAAFVTSSARTPEQMSSSTSSFSGRGKLGSLKASSPGSTPKTSGRSQTMKARSASIAGSRATRTSCSERTH
jgi:hypothetical protein